MTDVQNPFKTFIYKNSTHLQKLNCEQAKSKSRVRGQKISS